MSTVGINSVGGGATPVPEPSKPKSSASAGVPSSTGSAKTVDELKKTSPEFYEMTLMSIAQTTCQESRRHTEKIIQENKKQRQG